MDSGERSSGFSKIILVVVLAALSLVLGDLGERMARARAKEAIVRRQEETIAQLKEQIAWYEAALEEIKDEQAVVRWARAHAKYIFEGERLAIPVALGGESEVQVASLEPTPGRRKSNLEIWLEALLGP
jgi:arginase family enzyme